jgi:hypothetical protein
MNGGGGGGKAKEPVDVTVELVEAFFGSLSNTKSLATGVFLVICVLVVIWFVYTIFCHTLNLARSALVTTGWLILVAAASVYLFEREPIGFFESVTRLRLDYLQPLLLTLGRLIIHLAERALDPSYLTWLFGLFYGGDDVAAARNAD